MTTLPALGRVLEASEVATANSSAQTLPRPLRLWPGVAFVVLQLLGRFVVPWFVPEAMPFGVLGGLFFGVAIIVWWAFFSRAPGFERGVAVALIVAALAATPYFLHESIATGMMGMMFFIYAMPAVSIALVIWAVVSRQLSQGPRRATMVATILLACGGLILFKTAGFTGDGNSDFSFRWAETAEDKLLAQSGGEALVGKAAMPASVETGVGESDAFWPGFRGPHRDGVTRGVRLDTDWSSSPPVQLWRRPVGPGWSSFAVYGDHFFTQEQRGDDEVVSCYNATTGEPVWRHSDPVRFWESNAGAGPRGTPTLSGGRIYSLGGTGIVNALEAADGAVVWSRNAATDTGAEEPVWGFSGSPLVVDDLLIVAASGKLIGYDLATGEPRWRGPEGSEGYASPHWVSLDGVSQVLHLSGDGISGVGLADGSLLWEHTWSGYPIVQPALTADGDVLISVSDQSGTRRLAVTQDVTQGTDGWRVEERWTSLGLKSYFNDFVVHEGHAYGFDGRILAAIDLEDGERQWKGGRYGNGQLLLLPEQDVLLVLSEKGELAIVGATPDAFNEMARSSGIEGRTWNHPVLVGDLLLVRNSEEMAAFRLTLAEG